ncbi:unnamed protein product, partial [Rotaria sp. Silwood2]
LKIVNQALLTSMTTTEILEMGRSVVSRIQSTSINYYVVDPNNGNLGKKLNNSPISIIKLLKKTLAPNNKRTANDIEWSFSSDEDYYPPLLEQLYPSSVSSASDRADFQRVTIGRLDYFCEKYLHLNGVTEVGKFQNDYK